MLNRNSDATACDARDAVALRGRACAATAFPLATEAALELLRAGGNAVDAAAGAAWALSACEPSGSGLGGQTILLIRFADGRVCAIDGHSCAPAAASLESIGAAEQRRGYRSCTIPTTPATLDWVQRKYGVLSRGRVMEPAIRIAEEGYAITPLQHRQTAWVADVLRLSPAAAELFLRNDRPPEIGHMFRQPELARTLRRLADVGIEDFYQGAIASRIIADMQANGGLIAEADLKNCRRPRQTEPLVACYRGHRIVSVPPPGGGFQVLLALNILAQLVPPDCSADDRHEAIALATSAAFRERELQATARPEETLRRSLSSTRYARRLASDMREHAPGGANDTAEPPGETTHLSVSDRHGNVVALTQSIQSLFGAKAAHRDLGFLYNNYLLTCPRLPHPHALRPGCQPRSNAAPTLVLHEDRGAGRPLLALGAAGSRRIVSAIVQTISGIIDRRLDLAAALDAPRVHGMRLRKVWIEQPAASPALLARLRARGRTPIVKPPLGYAMGAVQALQFLPDATVTGAADPRRDGSVGVLH